MFNAYFRLPLFLLCVITLLAMLLPSVARAQNIYVVDSPSRADVKVYVVDHPCKADLVVYRTDRQSQIKSGENEGIWYETEWSSRADKKIYYTERLSQADLKVCFTDRRYKAGWRTPELRHLLE